MSIVLNGTTGITTPDLTSTDDITANSSAVLTSVSLPTELNATGSAPIYACRAWVNFNGTGDVAIRAAGNVSTITDNGPGDFTVNFTTAMVDADYSAQGTLNDDAAIIRLNIYTASSVRLTCIGTGFTALDAGIVSVSIFR
jgi:hypothetical protein